MRAPPRGFSQLATSFVATQAKSSTIRRRCITDEYNIPADACANPMHGLIAFPPCGRGRWPFTSDRKNPTLQLLWGVVYLDTASLQCVAARLEFTLRR